MSEGNLRADQIMVGVFGKKLPTRDFNLIYEIVSQVDDDYAKRLVELVKRLVEPAAAVTREAVTETHHERDGFWHTVTQYGDAREGRREDAAALLRIIMARYDAASRRGASDEDESAGGTYSCPKCGKDTPHRHD